MTTHELLEMMSLDALGLLDDDEREEFERAFQAAPPAVQAQIRREQARLARADAFLPPSHIEPPPGLRARVMAAVREAMQSMTVRRRDVATLLPFPGGVSRIWRAAAIGLAAASIVLTITTLYMKNQFAEVSGQMARNQQLDRWVQDFGIRFRDAIFASDTEFVKFNATPAAASPSGKAAALLLLEGDHTSGQLLLKDLPSDPAGYALHVVDADGNIIGDAVITFRASEPFKRIKGLDLKPGQGLAIVSPSAKPGDKPATMLRSMRS